MSKELGEDRIVVVTWLDHASYNTSQDVWFSSEDYKDMKLSQVVSVGFLLHETEDTIVIASSRTDDGYWGQDVVIAKALIVEIKDAIY